MLEAMAKKKDKKSKVSNVVTFPKKKVYTDVDVEATPSMTDPPRPDTGYASAVQMLQKTIDDIESGKLNPRDVFVGLYCEDKVDDRLYTVNIRRFNLTPLELVGRMSHILRDLDI